MSRRHKGWVLGWTSTHLQGSELFHLLLLSSQPPHDPENGSLLEQEQEC